LRVRRFSRPLLLARPIPATSALLAPLIGVRVVLPIKTVGSSLAEERRPLRPHAMSASSPLLRDKRRDGSTLRARWSARPTRPSRPACPARRLPGRSIGGHFCRPYAQQPIKPVKILGHQTFPECCRQERKSYPAAKAAGTNSMPKTATCPHGQAIRMRPTALAALAVDSCRRRGRVSCVCGAIELTLDASISML
jgi:hypothetical protein